MNNKVGIIGAGHVGSHCAYAMLMQGVCDKIIFNDIIKQKAVSQALDCMDTLPFIPHRAEITAGELKDIAECDIVVIAVGGIQDEDRMAELYSSHNIIKDIVPKIMEYGFNGIFIVITNPVDIVTYMVQKYSGLPHCRVIGTGTGLDSARLQRILSIETGINPQSIQAWAVGEHGNSQVPVFSSASINGKLLTELIKENPEKFSNINFNKIEEKVIGAGWEIYRGKNSTEFGIGCTCAKLVKTIFHDEKTVLPCSVFLNGEYKNSGIYTGVPAVVGKNGVEYTVEIPLDEKEQEKFDLSCKIIKENIKKLEF